MAPLSHGADAQALRLAGEQLSRAAEHVSQVASTGRSLTDTLAQSWSGGDAEHFAGRAWPAAERQLAGGVEMLRLMGEAAVREADEQERASGEGGSAGGAPGGGAPPARGGGGSGDGGAADEGQSRDPQEYGDLPEGVRDQWATYSEDEKKAIIEQIIRERAEHYGINEPSVDFDDGMSGNGAWQERPIIWNKVQINEDELDDPMILHTVYHEMRHAAQHEAIRDADTFWWWEDPEYAEGMTPEQVQEWEDNFDDYQSPPTQEEWDEDYDAAKEKYDRYFEQPVEQDAREEGSDYLEDLTPEELERLLEESS